MLKSIIHDVEEEAKRAEVLDMDGAGSEVRLNKEEALVLPN